MTDRTGQYFVINKHYVQGKHGKVKKKGRHFYARDGFAEAEERAALLAKHMEEDYLVVLVISEATQVPAKGTGEPLGSLISHLQAKDAEIARTAED